MRALVRIDSESTSERINSNHEDGNFERRRIISEYIGLKFSSSLIRCSRVELVEDNVSLEKKIGQLQDHIDHMVDNSRQLEHNIEQESSHKLK